MKIHVSPRLSDVLPELTYIFNLLGINKKTNFKVQLTEDNTKIFIGPENTDSIIKVSDQFVEQNLSAEQFNKTGLFEFSNGEPDYISTAFFCVTSLQEFKDSDPDALGRFQYKNSYQAKLDNPNQNIVQTCFDKIADALQIDHRPERTSFFLSHDIDAIHGALLEDGFNVLKKGRIDLFLSLIFNAATGKPHWLNIDQILKIESEYDCRSAFYWIVNKGKVGKKLENADYTFTSGKIQQLLANVAANGSENGLHKSLSHESFQEEIKKFGSLPLGNRYHYLKFNLPAGYEAIEEAGISLDASLGFSEQCGFRNSYGLPFNPFNFRKKKPFSFVEVPLHIMDRTFFSKRTGVNHVEKEIFDFFESNKENCVLSVLWHNNFFSEYKYREYLSLYKKILKYIYENNFATISQSEIIKNYRMVWP